MRRPRGKPKKTSGESSRPESENDYLEQADEFESSGSKWKAGDPAKALRFYQKAIAAYVEGLSRFPKSFDLAYNKALLLYHITQEKRLLPLIGSLLELLKEALEAHRFALSIDQENPDVLFNTAQVLTSFAEELNDLDDQDPDVKAQAVSLLQEAVELFATCLARQEMEYSQMQEMQGAVDEASLSAEAQQAPPPVKTPDSKEGEHQWAVVLESVTPATLIETALAQLRSLSSLATMAAPCSSSQLANLFEIATPIFAQKLPDYIRLLPTSVPEDASESKSAPFLVVSNSSSSFHPDAPAQLTNPQAEAKLEADLVAAVFKSALSGAEYKSKLASTETYASRIKQAFSPLFETTNAEATPSPSSIQILSAYADALIDLADSVFDFDPSLTQSDSAATRWTSLTQAQELLTKVTTLLTTPGASSSSDLALPGRAQVYLQRGDIELLRSMIAHNVAANASISSSLPTLLKNAGVYYRGARGLAGQDGNGELRDEAGVKAGAVRVTEGIWGDGVFSGDIAEIFQGIEGEVVRRTLNEIVEEGLIEERVKRSILGQDLPVP